MYKYQVRIQRGDPETVQVVDDLGDVLVVTSGPLSWPLNGLARERAMADAILCCEAANAGYEAADAEAIAMSEQTGLEGLDDTQQTSDEDVPTPSSE